MTISEGLSQQREASEPPRSGLDSAVTWLLDNELPAQHVASLFGLTTGNVRIMAYRYRHASRKQPVHAYLTTPLLPPADSLDPATSFLRQQLGVRLHEDSVLISRREQIRLSDLEDQVERASASLLQQVQYERGLPALRARLSYIGYSAHHRRLRLFARLRHLIAEVHQHSGRSVSALNQALRAMHLARIAYHESGEKLDLERMAKSALVASLAHQLRAEPVLSEVYLDLHKSISEAAGSSLSADYYRQLGVLYFQLGRDEEARPNLHRAEQAMPEAVEPSHYPRQYEPLTFTARNLYLLQPVNWESMLEIFEHVSSRFPTNDIRVSMHLNATVACGFSIDSPSANIKAHELLEQHGTTSAGFGHQVTRTKLLGMTPGLPPRLRPAWARRALYENAFRNQ